MAKSENLRQKENYFMKLKNKIKAPFEGGKNSRFKIGINKFAKAILTMIAILPVAGLFIVVGKIIGPLGFGQITSIAKVANHIGTIIETIGWMPFRHIELLFAIAMGGSWAKNRAGGCFAGAIAYLTLLSVGATFFVNRTGTDGTEFMNYILGGKMNPTKRIILAIKKGFIHSVLMHWGELLLVLLGLEFIISFLLLIVYLMRYLF